MQIRPLLAKLDSIAACLQSPLLLVIRLYWGWQFAVAGWGKLTHLDRTAGFFETLEIPLPKLNAIRPEAPNVLAACCSRWVCLPARPPCH